MKKTDKKRESMVFYRSFLESIGRFPDDVQLALYRAVAEFGLDHKTPDFTGVSHQPFVEAVWSGIRPQLDANWKRYNAGCLGGAPVGNRNNPNGRKGKTNQESTENQPNVNVNDNEKVNEKRGNEGLTLPFTDNPEFVETWNKLRATAKWKHKTVQALNMALRQLGRFDVRFSISLMESAIAGNFQGVVFPDTQIKYERWKRSHPQQPRRDHGVIVTDVENIYK